MGPRRRAVTRQEERKARGHVAHLGRGRGRGTGTGTGRGRGRGRGRVVAHHLEAQPGEGAALRDDLVRVRVGVGVWVRVSS